jgi:hypothetical protein
MHKHHVCLSATLRSARTQTTVHLDSNTYSVRLLELSGNQKIPTLCTCLLRIITIITKKRWTTFEWGCTQGAWAVRNSETGDPEMGSGTKTPGQIVRQHSTAWCAAACLNATLFKNSNFLNRIQKLVPEIPPVLIRRPILVIYMRASRMKPKHRLPKSVSRGSIRMMKFSL